jgi:MerR family redox-sensitive transcriptional activator SoxR
MRQHTELIFARRVPQLKETLVGLLIGEVARRAGLSTSALRYYERVGLLPPAARISKRRIYDSKVLGRIRIILLALDAGFTIKLDAQVTRLTQMKSILNDSFHCRCTRIEDCERYMAPSDRVVQ